MRLSLGFALVLPIATAALGLAACTGTRTPCGTQDWPPLRIAIASGHR
jgi:hypothetical protein